MTHREQQLLSFIESYQREHAGVTPTRRQMLDAVGWASMGSLYVALRGLEARGRIRYGWRREIYVIRQATDLAHISDAALFAEYHKRTAYRHSVTSAAVEV